VSTFVLECELKDPQHKIEVYAGGESAVTTIAPTDDIVDELSGCSTTEILDLKLEDYMFDDVQESAEVEDITDGSSIEEKDETIENIRSKAAPRPPRNKVKVEAVMTADTSRERVFSYSPLPEELDRLGEGENNKMTRNQFKKGKSFLIAARRELTALR
jgi:hypothetical protein